MAYITKDSQVKSFKPKKKHKQTKKKKVSTPLPDAEHICVGCGRTKYLEIHHVYPQSNRNNSSIYGCTVWLCHHCHRGQPTGVHGGNEVLNKRLKKEAQLKLMNNGMSYEEFISIFGRSYC